MTIAPITSGHRKPVSRNALAVILLVSLTLLAGPLGVASADREGVVPHAISRASTGPEQVSACPGTVPGALHTSGPWIVDAKGRDMRLAGVTWDGMQSTTFLPGGLQFQPYIKILCTIKQLGFNTVRIPLSDQLVLYNTKVTITRDIAANPTLAGLHPLQVLDRIVLAAQQDGLMIILDNHFSGARACPAHNSRCLSNGSEQNGTGVGTQVAWTDSNYTEQDWIGDWVALAQRYSAAHPCGIDTLAASECGSQPTVIGFDLHNEPHTNYGHHQYNLSDYLTRGSTWGPYPLPPLKPDPRWRQSSDWAAGAKLAGSTILTVNPHLLMFVEGVQLFPDTSQPKKVEVYTWGGILRGVVYDPITFTDQNTKQPILNQLVYSPHEWGPWKDNLLNEFSYRTSFNSLKKIFMKNWAFLLHQRNPVPIWLGEFDTCTAKIKCVSATKHGSQGQWFQLMLEFLKRNPQVGWSYYSVNGTNWLNEAEDNGILNLSWTGVKLPALMSALKPVE